MKKKRKFKTQRETARRKLPVLVRQFDNRCHWCGEPIVVRRELTPDMIIEERHGIVTISDGLNVKEIKLASVDHIKTLASGGSNDKKNCVPACWFCNNQRSNPKGGCNGQ